MQPAIAAAIAAEAPDSSSSTATRTRRSRARARQPTRPCLSRTSRPGCAAATSRCPRSTTGSRSDRLAWLLFCPDDRSRGTLEREGVLGRIYVVGDVMADASRLFAPIARARFPVPHEPRSYVVATIHRQANVEQPRLGHIVEGLNRIEGMVVFPVHPRTRARMQEEGLALGTTCGSSSRSATWSFAVARVAGARDRDRLGRPPEGGVLVRRARASPSGRRPSGSTRSRSGANVLVDADPDALAARGRERVDAARTGPCSTATGTPPSGSRRCSSLRSRADEAGRRNRRRRLRRPAARADLRRGRHERAARRRRRGPRRPAQRGESYIEDVPSEVLRPLVDARPRRRDDRLRRAARSRRDPHRAPDAALAAARARPLASSCSAAARDRAAAPDRAPRRPRVDDVPGDDARAGAAAPRGGQRAHGRGRTSTSRSRPSASTRDARTGRRRTCRRSSAASTRPRPPRRPRSTRSAIDDVHPVSSPEAAELTKLLENIFRSVNIALVNELAQLCDRMGIDVWEVVDAAATKPFGFMSFKPGPGLGGHCIPIDPFYLTWKAREFGFYTEFIELAGEGERDDAVLLPLGRLAGAEPRRGSDRSAARRILVLGVAYKPDISRHARVAGREADRAARERRRRRRLPRPARPVVRGERGRDELVAARAGGLRLRRRSSRTTPAIDYERRSSTTPASSSTSATRRARSGRAPTRSGSCDGPGRHGGPRLLGPEPRPQLRRARRARVALRLGEGSASDVAARYPQARWTDDVRRDARATRNSTPS